MAGASSERFDASGPATATPSMHQEVTSSQEIRIASRAASIRAATGAVNRPSASSTQRTLTTDLSPTSRLIPGCRKPIRAGFSSDVLWWEDP
jgi:hypothetical protein